MEYFGTTDFENNSRLITLSVIIISGLHCELAVLFPCEHNIFEIPSPYRAVNRLHLCYKNQSVNAV